jgi:plastocyanin domain-containing protein
MNKMKSIIILSTVAIVLIVGALFFFSGTNNNQSSNSEKQSVEISDGKQYVDILAKGGYFPRNNIAKAGIFTVIRMKTQSTFDCSSSVVIPSIGYRKNLPLSGTTEIEIPPQNPGTVLQGFCAMGMYSFSITFD